MFSSQILFYSSKLKQRANILTSLVNVMCFRTMMYIQRELVCSSKLCRLNWSHTLFHFGRPISTQVLTSWLMWWDAASQLLSSCCHLFSEVHQSLLQQRKTPAHNACKPPAPRFWLCSPVCKSESFSSKGNNDHCSQAPRFTFTRGQLQFLTLCAYGVSVSVWPFSPYQ